MNIAKLHQRFLVCSGVSTDTRKIIPESIFFALKGQNFNGNHYAAEALEKGAACVVVDQKEFAVKSDKYILVKDTLEALQHLATFHRKFLDIPIIAITGSNGKTTTKELVHAVLSKKYKTAATKGNLNNHIGVPLTLLEMDENTQMGIVEMGANHPGEIEFLCSITKPDYGYITNFGKAHLEGFGSLEGVIQAKSELYNYLKKDKKLLFLNLDDENQRIQLPYNHYFSFGTGRTPQVQVTYISGDQTARLHFNQTDFKSKLTGTYNAFNMAAALCIGLYFKVPLEEIKEAIEEYTPENNRSQILKKDSNTLFMDAYNANPTSMRASIENFDQMKVKGQKIVVLGDMLELGSTSETEHQDIVDLAESCQFDEVYLVGRNFKKTKTTTPTVIKFENTENLKKHFSMTEFRNCNFFIKGSRAMALEDLVTVL
ncbi:MAG: UDP-N-acetylmuramoyl-tripeptide--D-alanyl-D-alanine ligase [Bacteroidota bacterium]